MSLHDSDCHKMVMFFFPFSINKTPLSYSEVGVFLVNYSVRFLVDFFCGNDSERLDKYNLQSVCAK